MPARLVSRLSYQAPSLMVNNNLDSPARCDIFNARSDAERPQCIISVDISTTSTLKKETTQWYDLWASAVAVAGMCSQWSRPGIGTVIGSSFYFS